MQIKIIFHLKQLAFITICIFSCIYQVQSQSYMEWTSKYNGYIGNDIANDIALDSEGNIYVAGISETSNSPDYITVKYNSEGTKLWDQSFNGSANLFDEAKALDIDKNGNVIVTGRSKSSNSGYDILTIKYNSDGELQWSNVFNGSESNDDIANNLITDNYGNIYICGSANINGSSQKGIVLKYNSSGNLQWTKYLDLGKSTDILINGNGNIVVSVGNNITGQYKIYELSPSQGNQIFLYNAAGNTNNQLSGFPDKMINGKNGSFYVLSSYGAVSDQPVNINITKYSLSSPTPVWTKNITAEWIRGVDLKLDNDQNLYVLSDSKSNGQHKYQTTKLNSFGVSQWEKFSNPASGVNDFPVSLAINPENTQSGIFATGYNSSGDIFTINYTTSGQSGLTQVYNCYSCSTGADVPTSMVADRCDKIYITGYSNCDGTGKDIRTIKYSAYELPQISFPGTNSICIGEEITLSTDPCTGCSYQWSTGQTSESITIEPAESNSYTVTVTNAKNCQTSSYPILIYVNQPLTPVVTITASKTSICTGENVSFVATPVDGGIMPIYNWYVNGELKSNINSRYFSSNTLTNGSKVVCIMTSTDPCPAVLKDTSNVITIVVNEVMQTGITIGASDTLICAGQVVNFTALPLNGGTAPVFEWFVDGKKQNGNTSIFSTQALTNRSKVYATMTSNASCVIQPKAKSNTITEIVKPLLKPSIKIVVSEDTICYGDNVTFTAFPLDCGVNPDFKWYVNGILQTQTNSVFNTDKLENGSEVYVEISIHDDCTSSTSTTSNKISISVNPKLIPSVEIKSSENPICEGKSISFTATPINGGSSPQYQWYINDETQTETSGIFTSSIITDGSVISCRMISNAECLVSDEAISNEIKMTVYSVLNASVSVETASTNVSECEMVTFTATPGNGISFPVLKWFVNNNLTSYGQVFTTNSLIDGSRVYCSMETDEVCVNSSLVNSDTLTISVKPPEKPVIVFSNDTIYAKNYTSTSFTYFWYLNGEAISVNPFLVCNQFGSGLYSLVINYGECEISSDSSYIDCHPLNTVQNSEGDLIVYPNPASNNVFISYQPFRNSLVKIQVFDLQGKNIIEDILSFDALGVSHFATDTMIDGAYILAIFDNNINAFRYHKLLIADKD